MNTMLLEQGGKDADERYYICTIEAFVDVYFPGRIATT